MAEYIPFTPSDTNYDLTIPLNDVNYTFHVRWNSTIPGWFIDIYNADQSVIAQGVRLVLGGRIGSHNTDPFFTLHYLQLIDTSGQNLDPGYDDLGARVQLLHIGIAELQQPASSTGT